MNTYLSTLPVFKSNNLLPTSAEYTVRIKSYFTFPTHIRKISDPFLKTLNHNLLQIRLYINHVYIECQLNLNLITMTSKFSNFPKHDKGKH